MPAGDVDKTELHGYDGLEDGLAVVYFVLFRCFMVIMVY